MKLPPYLRTQGASVLIAVKVQPRASRSEIAGPLGEELKIKVAAPPVDGAANEALVEFLAKTLGLARRDVQLLRGATGTHKVFAVTGLSPELVLQRLGTGREVGA